MGLPPFLCCHNLGSFLSKVGPIHQPTIPAALRGCLKEKRETGWRNGPGVHEVKTKEKLWLECAKDLPSGAH